MPVASGFSWLPAEYEDGISIPRGLIPGQLYHGHPLPPVRQVSNEIIATRNEDAMEDQQRSLAFMHFGQFLDHHLGLAVMDTSIQNKEVQCGGINCNYAPPCFSIKILPGDPQFKKLGTCMPFRRTAPVCNPTAFVCQQIIAITAYLDASMVYGNEETLARSLWDPTGSLGLMAINLNFTDAGLALLPFGGNPNSPCRHTNRTANIPCFKAEDCSLNSRHLWTRLQKISQSQNPGLLLPASVDMTEGTGELQRT
ncbi:myeloperoxidase-like isoform X2 [Hemicordylus capensis]|uniref:myeloperoxidase-like isoform X2 n=1 Tax=Hemicordylus capensis TaxID=884348 RepID=UPI00230384A0|nr:myeloperoxidase-like isoform X2 [Hemicordylus capensis]